MHVVPLLDLCGHGLIIAGHVVIVMATPSGSCMAGCAKGGRGQVCSTTV
jgi:hypothetical protein